MATKIGKRVVDDLYVHVDAIDQLENVEHRRGIIEAMGRVPASGGMVPNVAKLNLRTGRLSLLAYLDFHEDPFPELAASWAFAPGFATPPTYRTYQSSLNPPILHRKELLVPASHPNREHWAEITKTAESLGLFDDTSTIGFRLNWTRLVESKGYRLVGASFHPIGNAPADTANDVVEASGAAIQRHLTAITRNNLSAPVQLLLRHGLLSSGSTFFDYGCGLGSDMAALSGEGFVAEGWDPHFAPERPIVEADVVNLGFVVNVIEDPAERVEAIQKAFRLTRRVMSIGVMLYGTDIPGRPFGDGFITTRKTFQKYFSQGELKDFIEHVLHQEAFMVGPGVAFVFADKAHEQRFNSGRYRSRGIVERLLAGRISYVRPAREPKLRLAKSPKPSASEALLASARPLLDSLWSLALDLGRMPELDEVPNLEQIETQIGSLAKSLRMLAQHYDPNLLAAAGRARSDDVRLYLAVQQFSKRRPYRTLEARLQRDIKAFFGDYKTAQDAAMQLLLDAADTSKILAACELAASAGLGYLQEAHSLQLHVSMVDRLPAVLRAYVACGLILWDAISEVQLVKIHVASGKLTLMEFDDFDSSPLPVLGRRIKVNIRKQDFDLFEYGTPAHPNPLLYRKSRYLCEDYANYAEQLAFDASLEDTGILDDSEFGPRPEQLYPLLESQRIRIGGMQLLRSQQLPDLDQKCGLHFTYRDFIECGETQSRLKLENVPRQPETFNALCDLARTILDPLIDYFGSIRLTYGFCSAELGKHISTRVAPKLDQHAAHELGRGGNAICDRSGAACDFIVDDEDMREVADWIIKNLPFDRLYFYGGQRPIHVSVGPQQSRAVVEMAKTATGRLVPRPYPAQSGGTLQPLSPIR